MLNILTSLYDQFIGFFSIQGWLDMYKSGDYSSLHTLKGLERAIGPLIPFLLIIEIVRAAFYKKFRVIDYKVQFFTYVFNAFVGQFLALAVTAFCISIFEKYSIFKTTFTWYWLIYGYIVWELSHFVYHFLAHKVRLL